MRETFEKHCFPWRYKHQLYLSPRANRRFLEEQLLKRQIVYAEEEMQLSLCERCMPTTPLIHTHNATLGFSDENYFFTFFSIELVSVPSLIEDAKRSSLEGISNTPLEEIVKLKKAIENDMLFKQSTFDRGFMLCSSCVTDKSSLAAFLWAYAQQRVAEYSTLLNPQKEHIQITCKRRQPYYPPQHIR